MPQPRRRRHGPRSDGRHALELLASRANGCAEAILLAHGFTIAPMVELVRAGLTTATAEHMVDGGKAIEIARVRITEVGRRASRVQLHSWRLAEESYGD